MGIKKRICKTLLKMMGWTTVGGTVPEDKAIILGVPHTSAKDFIISYLFYTAVGGVAHVIIKKEFFWGPLGPVLRSLGAVPVDRKHGAGVAKQMIDEMNKVKQMHLAIAPEGTRKKTAKWKTGFHTIAKATGAAVYLGYFDWGTKRVSAGEKFEISDDARADLEKIKAIYRGMNLIGKHKDCFSTEPLETNAKK